MGITFKVPVVALLEMSTTGSHAQTLDSHLVVLLERLQNFLEVEIVRESGSVQLCLEDDSQAPQSCSAFLLLRYEMRSPATMYLPTATHVVFNN